MDTTADKSSSAVSSHVERSRHLPAANLLAEMSLLGALMANNKAYDRVRHFLAPEHFADPLHAHIYAAIVRRIEAGQLADALTVRDDFRNEGKLAEIGGGTYLAQLLTAMVGIVSAGDQGRAIHGAWIGRDILHDLVSSQALNPQELGIPEEQLLSDLAADQAHQVVANDRDGERDTEVQAERLLEHITHGLDEAHARADRLLARMS